MKYIFGDFDARSASMADRIMVADTIASVVNKCQSRLNNIESLKRDGYVSLPRFVSSAMVNLFMDMLSEMPVYNAHVQRQSDYTLRTKEDSPSSISCYGQQRLVSNSEILSMALNPCLIDLVEQYLGCAPTIYSVNCFYSKAGSRGSSIGTQNYHRDLDDFRFLTLFVYLNDVGEKNGPHCYKKGSHVSNDGDGEEVILTGYAGDAFLADSYGFHKGMNLEESDRTMLWIRYGMYDNEMHYHDKNDTTRADFRTLVMSDREKYITRLLFNGNV